MTRHPGESRDPGEIQTPSLFFTEAPAYAGATI